MSDEAGGPNSSADEGSDRRSEAHALILFDGVCNLCNATVQSIIERDRAGRFRFASLQSPSAVEELGALIGSDQEGAPPDSIVLVDSSGAHTRSSAAIRIARGLGFPYALLGLATVVPRPLRDAVYSMIARNRYRWFGRRDTCMVPTPELADRFLDPEEARPLIDAADAALREGESSQSWVGPSLVRFAMVYLVVYMAPFPLSLLGYLARIPILFEVPGLLTAVGWVIDLHGQVMGQIVPWVGDTVFGVEATLEFTGSGDRTFNYVDGFVDLVLAGVLSLIWTLVAHGRRVSARAFDLSHVFARYYLATNLLLYGWIKVFSLQFVAPGPDRLLQTYGDSSPMGLAWTFLGASMGYQMFAGLAELIGGYLLFWRRTTLIGALVAAAVMTNVTVLNYFFDVPVKLFSTHLLLFALFIMAPDVPRLVGMFGFNLPVASRTSLPFWKRPARKATAVIAAHLLFVGGITTLHILGGYQQSRVRGVLAEPSPLAGIYRVESFLRDGVVDRANEDVDRWVRVGLNPPPTATIQWASGETVRMLLALDAEAGTVSFYDRGAQPPGEPMFTFIEVEEGVLRLEGEFEGKPTIVVMRKYEAPALLLERRFRWINEYPFNR